MPLLASAFKVFRPAGFLSLLLTGLASGCGEPDWQRKPLPPFAMGSEVGEGPASEPTIEVLAPADRKLIRLKPGGELDCRVRISYAGSGRLPIFLMAFIRDAKGGDAASVPLEPIEHDGRGAFSLGSRLRAPSRPAKYRLEVEAVFIDVEATNRAGTHEPPVEKRSTIPAAELEVTGR